jgi:maltooligosyltrehalose synthase
VIVVAGRLYASLGLAPNVAPLGEEAWGDTAVDLSPVAARTLSNALTGESFSLADGRLPLARACASFPVALFAYGGEEPSAGR